MNTTDLLTESHSIEYILKHYLSFKVTERIALIINRYSDCISEEFDDIVAEMGSDADKEFGENAFNDAGVNANDRENLPGKRILIN